MTLYTGHNLAVELNQLEVTCDALVDRLDRVLTALTLTIDAQAAVEDQLTARGCITTEHELHRRRLERLADRCRATLRALRDDR